MHKRGWLLFVCPAILNMAYNSTKGNLGLKDQVLTMCWQYIYENFHKFNDSNKLKVALALTVKTIPQQIEGSAIGETKIIIVRSDGNKAEAVAGSVPVQQAEIPGTMEQLGDGKNSRLDIAGNVIQRGNS